jgi:hypothetical protein
MSTDRENGRGNKMTVFIFRYRYGYNIRLQQAVGPAAVLYIMYWYRTCTISWRSIIDAWWPPLLFLVRNF